MKKDSIQLFDTWKFKFGDVRLNHTVLTMSFLPPTFSKNGGGTVFTGVCPHLGGYPHLADGGGVPSSFPMGGTPILPSGGYPIPSQDGGGGTPSKIRTGVPPSQVKTGLPQHTPIQVKSQVRMGGIPNWNNTACTCYAVGGMPLCIHTGGLSCFTNVFYAVAAVQTL